MCLSGVSCFAFLDFQVLPKMKCKGDLPGLMSIREDLIKNKEKFWDQREKELESRRLQKQSDGAGEEEPMFASATLSASFTDFLCSLLRLSGCSFALSWIQRLTRRIRHSPDYLCYIDTWRLCGSESTAFVLVKPHAISHQEKKRVFGFAGERSTCRNSSDRTQRYDSSESSSLLSCWKQSILVIQPLVQSPFAECLYPVLLKKDKSTLSLCRLYKKRWYTFEKLPMEKAVPENLRVEIHLGSTVSAAGGEGESPKSTSLHYKYCCRAALYTNAFAFAEHQVESRVYTSMHSSAYSRRVSAKLVVWQEDTRNVLLLEEQRCLEQRSLCLRGPRLCFRVNVLQTSSSDIDVSISDDNKTLTVGQKSDPSAVLPLRCSDAFLQEPTFPCFSLSSPSPLLAVLLALFINSVSPKPLPRVYG
ncbi:hypothetical protein TGDOM2_249290A [Toxoplasma gondii GAB2-2007-GAL-DOM2]|uniref:Uncharacterized protein n=1 Tax=Toxoplasma gondii GAB2-2007-GAL-DOM2 TaxID=1130820 RepID=A0A086KPM1_TOXGO|nr:hypothetical protein TGDOM2_249290A [Toxoplasma gondii GAB2-2007-GAL-DOM2]